MLTLTTRNLAILSVLMLTLACSSKEVKPLSGLELAKQLLHEQQSKEIPPAHKVLKVHITQPSKAVIERPLDIAIEIVAGDSIAPITLTYAADENFKLPRKWKFYHQDSIEMTIKQMDVDKIYPRTLTVIPQQEGRLEFKFYVLYQHGGQQLAREFTLPVLIGSSIPANKLN